MPKKSDRPDHGSAMSDLMPDVSLDEGSGEDSESAQEQKKSTKEDQNSSTSEENNGGASAQKSESADSDASSSPSGSGLEIYPKQSPDLSEKLGLLVSDEVEGLLDEAYLSMRMEHGKKAKKSLIVEAALRYLLNDYQQNGAADSELSRWMRRVAE